jgi:multidrug efflux pump subunit AcrA (membrane-fusion protein)
MSRMVATRAAKRTARIVSRLGFVAALSFTPLGSVLAADPNPAPEGMAVSVVTAARTCFNATVRVTGTLSPRGETAVRPAVEGYRVTDVLVDDGDSVKAGQVLARLTRAQAPATSPVNATVEAPVAGVISRSSAQIGVMASAGTDPLFRIITGDEFELDATVPLARIAKLQPGQKARIDVAGVGEVAGRVRLVAPEIDTMTQMGRTRITLDKNDKLRTGMFASARINTGSSCNPSVPLSAVLYGSDSAVVQVVRNNRIETRPVSVGIIFGENAEILEGLSVGDQVVVRAGGFLREDDLVRPVQLHPAASGEAK